MKIKILATALILVFAVLSACTGAPVDSTSASSDQAVPTETTLLTGPFVEKDMIFSLEGKDFLLLSDVRELLGTLGDGYELTAAPSCMFEGEDKIFKYPGMEIFTYPIEGMDQIDEIMITGTDFATARGISVGDTYEAVVRSYGEGIFDEVVLTYILSGDPEDHASPRLIFGIDSGKVSYISYYSSRNMW